MKNNNIIIMVLIKYLTRGLVISLFGTMFLASCSGLSDEYYPPITEKTIRLCDVPKFYDNQAGTYQGLVLRQNYNSVDTICKCSVEFTGYNNRMLTVHGFPVKLLAQTMEDDEKYAEYKKTIEKMPDSIDLTYRYVLLGFVSYTDDMIGIDDTIKEDYDDVFDYEIADNGEVSSGKVDLINGQSESYMKYEIRGKTGILGSDSLSEQKRSIAEWYDYQFCNGIQLDPKFLSIGNEELPIRNYFPYFFIRIYEDGTENLPDRKK